MHCECMYASGLAQSMLAHAASAAAKTTGTNGGSPFVGPNGFTYGFMLEYTVRPEVLHVESM